MEIDFAGKTVLVTGAGIGIGAALARGFGRQGAQVIVHHNRSAADARAVADDIGAAGGQASLVQGDLTDRAVLRRVCDAVVTEHGGVDVLVNNSGGLVSRSPVEEIPDELYDTVLELNFGSMVGVCRALVPGMRRRGGGSIINLTSVAARTGGAGGASLYAASKGAVSSFTRALAKELAPDGIRVNAISPGIIDTAFHAQTAPELFQAFVAAIPLGRPGDADEIVGPALFLASDELSSYVTGAVLEVNGGQVLG